MKQLKVENNTLSGSEQVKHQGTARHGRLKETEAEESLQRRVAKEFSRAVRCAEKAAAKGRPELAVEWCRYAATLAWEFNPGFFYSHDVERLLAEIGRQHLRSAPAATIPTLPPQRFLHVMSSAYETGGHTRAVSRWIEICAQQSPSEHHSILISKQCGEPLPAWLGDSARKTGGEIVELPCALSWLQAAAEIRSRSFEFDVIILHIHPHDPLPNLAFFDQPKPVLFFRHADHVFNLGIDAAQVIADVRPVGHEMSVHFCAQAPQKVTLPLPLFDEETWKCDKAHARRQLGFPAHALIALTVGRPLRFSPIGEHNFSTVVRSLCERNSRVYIVAVGLTESEPFPGLGQLMNGRFIPAGLVKDREILELYYKAADIYLDAYPCSSGTAFLDAARHGLPVQRLYNQYRCLMWGDDPGLDSVSRGVSSHEEFIATTLEWLEWPKEKRSKLGRSFRDAVLLDHCGASWKSRWLDPAVKALTSPGYISSERVSTNPSGDGTDFPGLGIAGPENDWPDGMFVAGTILSDGLIPLSIRISGVFRSIKPLLFHKTGDGMTAKRFLIFRSIVASCVPIQIRMPVRKMRSAIFKNLKHQSKSTN